MLQTLESRVLLAGQVAPPLIFVGTESADRIVIRQHRNSLLVNINGVRQEVNNRADARIFVYGYGGDDLIRLENVKVRADISAGGGNDTVIGGRHADQIGGGEGNDWISGGEGDDLISGHEGEDTLVGGDGDDQLLGGPGRDHVLGGRGDDVLAGDGEQSDDDAEDRLDGGPGFDWGTIEPELDLGSRIERVRTKMDSMPRRLTREFVRAGVWEDQGVTSVRIFTRFGTGGHFTTWSAMTRRGREFTVHESAYLRPGLVTQALETHARDFELGRLEAGQYTLRILSDRGRPITMLRFEVPVPDNQPPVDPF